MIQLPNDCYCSDLCVHPKNWKTVSASVKISWFISYRFYDPSVTDDSGKIKPKLIIIKGMNHLKTLKERQNATTIIMDEELSHIRDRGYNPIKKTYAEIDNREITEFSLLPEGLEYAYKQLQVGKATKEVVGYCKSRVQEIIIALNFKNIQLRQIKTRHIRKIINTCTKNYKLSAQSFNHYRAYLIMLFKVLLADDAVDYNPVLNIEKKQILKKMKVLLTKEERKNISDHFHATNIYYYRFMQCFFHSGARPLELLELKKEDVDLVNLTYKLTVNKGQLHEEQRRPVKHIAVEFWRDQLAECNDGDYVFGSCLKPGTMKGTRDYITKKWGREVKRDMNIKKDFYSLKHSNLDETAALLDAKYASKQAGHTSTVITMKHYLVNEKQREDERLKEVNNPLA